MLNKEDLLNRISVDPKVMVGKPVIKGTRLTVQFILGLLSQGMSFKDLLEQYVNITEEDILACLAFAQESLENTFFMPSASNA